MREEVPGRVKQRRVKRRKRKKVQRKTEARVRADVLTYLATIPGNHAALSDPTKTDDLVPITFTPITLHMRH